MSNRSFAKYRNTLSFLIRFVFFVCFLYISTQFMFALNEGQSARLDKTISGRLAAYILSLVGFLMDVFTYSMFSKSNKQ